MDKTLLEQGINALRRAADVGWFEGHIGASILAGHFLIAEGHVTGKAAKALRAVLDRMIAGNAASCAPLEDSAGADASTEQLVAAIRQTSDNLCLSGHPTIFSALALKAFHAAPALVTAAAVDDVRRLHELAYKQDDRRRYFRIPDHRTVDVPESQAPAYKDMEDLVRAAFYEAVPLYADAVIDDAMYFFAGEKIHGITHAHAIVELAALGHGDIAKAAFDAHRRQLWLNRQTPPGRPGLRTARIETRPTDAAFWAGALGRDIAHIVKLAYASARLKALHPGDVTATADDVLSYYWAHLGVVPAVPTEEAAA